MELLIVIKIQSLVFIITSVQFFQKASHVIILVLLLCVFLRTLAFTLHRSKCDTTLLPWIASLVAFILYTRME